MQSKQYASREGGGETHTKAETHLHTYIIQLSACVCVCVCICQFEALAIVCLPTKAPAAACRAKGEDGEGAKRGRVAAHKDSLPRPALATPNAKLNSTELKRSFTICSMNLNKFVMAAVLSVSVCVCMCV